MKRLEKQLTLFDVYAISTGAMFSSGFFLLPGLAAARAGPAVVLAYLIAGLLILPAMLSMAELSTAMPRAGGAYYFLDRSLGPMAGTVGGLGTWIALVLKSAFALIGMGAYLAFFLDVPILTVALGFTAVFTLVNVIGAKETGGLQRVLVAVLLAVLAFFLVQGGWEVAGRDVGRVGREQFTPFFPFGAAGLFSTVGLVFVSYAGLTKVASVSEEVRDPDRNIPLGMVLSLLTATVVYVGGVAIMVALLDPEEFHHDLAPVATAAESFFDWLPHPLGLVLIVIAAIAAFASTANAGIMAASRYVLAMARDRLLWTRLARVGRFGTPTAAVLATGAVLVLSLVTLDVENVAKLASAFQLLIFAFISLAVIVMRESRIEGYDPGFVSPLYPWLHIAGFIVPFLLIVQMGWLAVLFTMGIVAGSIGWYLGYAKPRVVRDGAMFHVFERLGQRRFTGLEAELREILMEQGVRAEDPFDELVTAAVVIDRSEGAAFDEVATEVAEALGGVVPVAAGELASRFLERAGRGGAPVANGVLLAHAILPEVNRPRLALIRSRRGIRLEAEAPTTGHRPGRATGGGHRGGPRGGPVRAAFFLVSPAGDASGHLRLLAHLAGRADDADFLDEWERARNEQELKEAVLHNERYLSVRLREEGAAAELIGHTLREVPIPARSLVALVRREGDVLVPRGSTVLKAGDRLTIIGEPGEISELRRRYRNHP